MLYICVWNMGTGSGSVVFVGGGCVFWQVLCLCSIYILTVCGLCIVCVCGKHGLGAEGVVYVCCMLYIWRMYVVCSVCVH